MEIDYLIMITFPIHDRWAIQWDRNMYIFFAVDKIILFINLWLWLEGH